MYVAFFYLDDSDGPNSPPPPPIYIYIYIQPLRFEKEITRPGLKIEGKFTRSKIILFDRLNFQSMIVNNFTSLGILMCTQNNKLQQAIIPKRIRRIPIH